MRAVTADMIITTMDTTITKSMLGIITKNPVNAETKMTFPAAVRDRLQGHSGAAIHRQLLRRIIPALLQPAPFLRN